MRNKGSYYYGKEDAMKNYSVAFNRTQIEFLRKKGNVSLYLRTLIDKEMENQNEEDK